MFPKFGHFVSKMAIFTNFSKVDHRILLIFAIETNFLEKKKSREKSYI